jgi:hypothetical protein
MEPKDTCGALAWSMRRRSPSLTLPRSRRPHDRHDGAKHLSRHVARKFGGSCSGSRGGADFSVVQHSSTAAPPCVICCLMTATPRASESSPRLHCSCGKRKAMQVTQPAARPHGVYAGRRGHPHATGSNKSLMDQHSTPCLA